MNHRPAVFRFNRRAIPRFSAGNAPFARLLRHTGRRMNTSRGTAKSAPALPATEGPGFEGLNKCQRSLCPRPQGKGCAISACADVPHEQFFFERQRSLALRSLEWEGLIRPMMSWSALILRGPGVAVVASAILPCWSRQTLNCGARHFWTWPGLPSDSAATH
jgi:hypothetical protein